MVLPFLAGLAGLALAARIAIPKILPRIIPFATKAFQFFAKKPVKRLVIPSILVGAALESPTIRETLKRAPTAPLATGRKLGIAFEERIAPEIKKKKGAAQKALEIGGLAGLAAATGIVVAKKIREKRAAVPGAIAAAPAAIQQAIPTMAAPGGVVPSLAAPQAAIVAPAAVEEPIKRKRRLKPKVSPMFINQIQISTD